MDDPANQSTAASETELQAMRSEIDRLREENTDLEAQISRISGASSINSEMPLTSDQNFVLSSSNLAHFLTSFPVPVLISTYPSGEILFVNNLFCHAIDREKQTVLGKKTIDFYSDRKDIREIRQELDESGEALQRMVQFVLADGSKFDTLLASRKITFQDQPCIFSVLTDISEQANMYRRLRESETRYRLLVENAPEGIILFDVKERQCIDFNRSALELLGYSEQKLKGSATINLFPKLQFNKIPSLKLFRQYFRQAIVGKNPVFEWQLIDQQGVKILCEVRLIAYDLAGRKFIQCSILEVGEKRKLEAQISRNQRFQVLGRLTGGIAHDFNNILAIILGHAELLAEKLVDTSDSTDRLIQKIIKSSVRGEELTQKLLSYSRNQPLLPEQININDKIRDIANILESQVSPNVKIEFKLAPDVWNCAADPVRLEGAILSLCLNAKDSMPDGGTLTIETSNADLDDEYVTTQLDLTAGEYVQVSISDTGAGIETDDIEYVFDPFFTTQDFGQNSGLGLSMVFGFAKQSSGHVSIYSEVGHGTVARIYLPKFAQKPELKAERKTPSSERAERTVLLVEDNPDLRLLALNLLQSMNYNVLEAKNADTALEILKQNTRINLLLTDFVLEDGMNGEKLAREARKLSVGLPVLIMTGYTKEIISSLADFEDDTVFLHKPFRKAELSDKILEAMGAAVKHP